MYSLQRSAARLTAVPAMNYALDAMFAVHHHAHDGSRQEAGRA